MTLKASSPPFSQVGLTQLIVPVRVGFSVSERALPQPIRFDLHIRFKAPPLACQSDQLDQTLCYFELSQKIKNYCESREFALLEHLTWKVFHLLKAELAADLHLTTTKENFPLDTLRGSAYFSLGDWN